MWLCIIFPIRIYVLYYIRYSTVIRSEIISSECYTNLHEICKYTARGEGMYTRYYYISRLSINYHKLPLNYFIVFRIKKLREIANVIPRSRNIIRCYDIFKISVLQFTRLFHRSLNEKLKKIMRQFRNWKIWNFCIAIYAIVSSISKS